MGSPMKVILEEVRKALDRILTNGQAALNRFHERLREASSELVLFPDRFVDTRKLPLTLDSCLRGND